MTPASLRILCCLAAAAAVLPSAAAAQRQIRTVRIGIEPAQRTTTIVDSMRGYTIVDYLLAAREGQHLTARMTTSNGANYFNIMAPGEEMVAFFNGSMAENRYEGLLESSGDFTLRVYLMRSAARRNEIGRFRLEVTLADSAGLPQDLPPTGS